jgi:hypothetical protein
MDNTQSMTLFAEADLSVQERTELERYEKTIERGLDTFVSVGNALLAIRRDRLYRVTHGTFEAYCVQRWQMTRDYADKLIVAAKVVGNLTTIVGILPATESQARPLIKLEPEEQREAWTKAVETAPNGKVTAAHVQKVADEYEQKAEDLSSDRQAYDWTIHDTPGTEDEWAHGAVGLDRDWTEEEYDDLAEANAVIVPEEEEEAVNIEDVHGHVETVFVQPSKMAVHFSSDTPEHYTPKEIIEAVIECMGAIDLDPCSNSYESPNVPAGFHFTQADDGLSKHWAGRVYMNPPYGREISKWVDKLCAEYNAGRVSEAIALVPARTDTDWFDQLIDGYKFHCFVHGRLVFIGNDNSAPFPSAIVYLGTEWGRFYQAFRSFGRIVQEANPEMFGQ